MAANPAFEQVLQEMRELHARKNHDYAADANPFSNFEEAAAFAGVDADTVFRVLIGIKIARLKELQASGKAPANESVDDSRMDLIMYGALQRAYAKKPSEFTHIEFGLCENCGLLHSSAEGCACGVCGFPHTPAEGCLCDNL